jgi:hypothetical protein
MDWKKVTSHLYSNIKPVGGRLRTIISDYYNSGIQFDSLWVEFDMNEFFYEDPFYGEQKSTDPFNMNVDLMDIAYKNKLRELHEFEGRMFVNNEDSIEGGFSNSLDVVPKYVKFHAIEGNKIGFEMKYSLTNTDSYGNMDGTKEEHLQSSGSIAVPITISDLEIRIYKEGGLKKILRKLNPDIYDLDSVKLTSEDEGSNGRKEYTIQYKSIKPKPRKWWRF